VQEHPSWWRKLARAEYHFQELTRLVRRYEDEHHYRAVLVDGLPERRFVLEITEQPDADIAVVLGDCLFNIRSALDHIAVACAGMDVRHKAQSRSCSTG
jgi:hypothetical protein